MKRFLETYPVASVMLLMFLCLAPVMAMRDFSPGNELRYLSIADEAIANGDIFAFTNHGLAYADKPPLYFWLIMLCRLIFGSHSMFVLSLFSFIPAMVIIAVMDKWMCGARGLFDDKFNSGERAGAALLLGTSGLFLGMSVFLRMDMLMCMWIVLALYAFSEGRPVAFAAYTFLALFTKGPVGIMAPLLSVLVFLLVTGRRRELGRWFGWKTWAILAGGCIVWFGGVFLDGGREYLSNLVVHQTVGRAVNSFHHKAPWWFYIVCIWEVMAPWCILTVPAVVIAMVRKGRKTDEPFWGWTAFATFVMLSCFSSKIAIYLAPVFPFVAYVFPVEAKRLRGSAWIRIGLVVPALLFVALGLVLVAAGAFFGPLSGVLSGRGVDVSAYGFVGGPLTVIAGAVMVAGGVLGMIRSSRQWYESIIPMAVSLLVGLFLVSWMMPSINDFAGYRSLCREIPEDMEVYAWKCYRPENIDVYLGHEITVMDPEAIAIGEDGTVGDVAEDAGSSDSIDMAAAKAHAAALAISGVVPEDAAFMARTKRFPDGIEGRQMVIKGDYAVFLPLK